MLNFNTVQNSSDLASYNTKDHNELDVEISKKDDLASNIVRKFLSSILADTLTNTSKQMMVYEYEVEDDINLSELQFTVDTIIYRIFNKNLYAMPDVFFKTIDKVNDVNRILIHSPNTVKTIIRTDERLEKEISEFIMLKSETLSSGHAIVYTGFEHCVASLPNAYAKSRGEHVVGFLKNKGYKTHWDPDSMYLTISVK